jgi:hypothetical protein
MLPEPMEVHTMPDETEVWYRESDHSYWRSRKIKPDGTEGGTGRLVGVSTVVAPLDFRPDGLLSWAARLTCEGVASLSRAGDAPPAWLESGESINGALMVANLTWQHLRDQAATRGTNVHLRDLHALARGAAVPDFAALTEEEQGYARGVLAFWHEHEPYPFESEQVVWSATHGVAGRFDLRCLLDGEVVLLDAKTANSSFVPAKHHGQLAGYELLARECGIGPSARQVMLRVDAEGGYELIDSTAGPEDFLAALTVYRASARIARECKTARKAVAA